MTQLRNRLVAYLAKAEATAPATGPSAVLAACDLVYGRYLLGLAAFETSVGFRHFLTLLSDHRLAGATDDRGPSLSVHLTAYALASLALAGPSHTLDASAFVRRSTWDSRRLIDPDSLMPRWPRRYSHHAWRVGHWVGGAPAILRLVRQLAPEIDQAMPATSRVLETCDSLIDDRTGLLRTWRSPLLQSGFRHIYRLRHDPEVGAVGGIAHLHWINHAEGRTPYRAADPLFQRASILMQRRPFIERVPYCLDFDVLQIVRTAATAPLADALRQRAGDYAQAIAAFLMIQTPQTYALHRLPGALAALHECALIQDETRVEALATPARDIILDAGWL